MRSLLFLAVALVGCKAKPQPDPQPTPPSPNIGWNTNAQEPLPAEIKPDRFRGTCRRVAQLNGAPIDTAEIEACAEEARDAWQQDPAQFDAQERCFFDHNDLAEAEACASNVDETVAPPDPTVEARARRLCKHMVELAKQEGVGVVQSVDDCMASSLEERMDDPAAFDRWAECVPKTTTMAEALQCGTPPA